MSSKKKQAKRVRVLVILPSLVRAGAETQTVTLLNGLNCDEFEKTLVTFESQRDLEGTINSEEVKYIHVSRTKRFDWNLSKKIAEIIDENTIDVVYCALQIALFYGWCGRFLSSRRPGIVLGVHTTINRSERLELFDRVLYRWLMRTCSRVVFVCETQRKHWVKKFPFLAKKSVVIYNGISSEWFSRCAVREEDRAFRQYTGIDDNAFVIAHIAGFRPEKGHAILLEAFGSVLTRHANAVLVFAGDGALRSEIENRARALGLTESVRFLGSVADVRPLLNVASVSVISSFAVETFSIAMLESLSMEVPMVATDIGGTREAVIDGYSGRIVPAQDVNALASALDFMIENEPTRAEMARNARDVVVKNFTVEKMVSTAAAVFNDVIGEPSAARP